MRQLRPIDRIGHACLGHARFHLRVALEHARRAGATSLVKKIQSALKSQEGAVRHAARRPAWM